MGGGGGGLVSLVFWTSWHMIVCICTASEMHAPAGWTWPASSHPFCKNLHIAWFRIYCRVLGRASGRDSSVILHAGRILGTGPLAMIKSGNKDRLSSRHMHRADEACNCSLVVEQVSHCKPRHLSSFFDPAQKAMVAKYLANEVQSASFVTLGWYGPRFGGLNLSHRRTLLTRNNDTQHLQSVMLIHCDDWGPNGVAAGTTKRLGAREVEAHSRH